MVITLARLSPNTMQSTRRPWPSKWALRTAYQSRVERAKDHWGETWQNLSIFCKGSMFFIMEPVIMWVHPGTLARIGLPRVLEVHVMGDEDMEFWDYGLTQHADVLKEHKGMYYQAQECDLSSNFSIIHAWQTMHHYKRATYVGPLGIFISTCILLGSMQRISPWANSTCQKSHIPDWVHIGKPSTTVTQVKWKGICRCQWQCNGTTIFSIWHRHRIDNCEP